ncbi:MAG: DUF2652 domain-containing protein [Labilithrix sp.]|nr:DUF2652 domain-containing protein [Labilithrix sp.]MCW5814547.1 DUF2652 domain-containing protein [Labilithrix sp.]
MKLHRVNLAHAQVIIATLLEAVIDGAEPKLKLAKLEGDAAFFYAKLPQQQSDKDALAQFASIAGRIRRAFLEKQAEFESDRLCNCDSCVQAAQLTLKFVAHVGEVAFQRIKRLTELAGVDVIFVHRLLKNNVPIPEYMLMSEPVFERLDPDLKPLGKESKEDLEGLGEVKTIYIDFTEIAKERPEIVQRSFFQKLSAWFKLTLRAIPFFANKRKSCEGFRNFPGIEPPPDSLVLPAGVPSMTPPSMIVESDDKLSVAPPTKPSEDLPAATKADGA